MLGSRPFGNTGLSAKIKTLDIKREVLIGFGLLLVPVLALLLYSISARSSDSLPNRFNLLQLVLVVSAIIVEVLALWLGHGRPHFGIRF